MNAEKKCSCNLYNCNTLKKEKSLCHRSRGSAPGHYGVITDKKKDNSVLAAVSRGSRNLRRMVAQNHKQQDKHKFLDAGSVMIKYFGVGLFPRKDVRK